jgi:hypothetical protein
MSAQPVSALRRLVERGEANSPPPSTSNATTVGDANSVIRNVVPMDAIVVTPADLVDERDFEGLDENRVPQLERRQLEPTARGGPHSWVYRHGWPV